MTMKTLDVPATGIGEVSRWKGDFGRTPRVQRPCECGCDLRDGAKGVGYLTGSDSDGNGFTLWITDEKLYKTMEKAFQQAKKG